MVALAEAFVKIRPEVDTTAFKRDVTALRGEIDKLRGKDIVIGVDVTKAYIDVVTLKEEIQQINRLRPTVRADANTSAAMAQIAALAAEARKLGGLNPTVRPEVDDSGVRAVGDAARRSSSGVSALVAAGITIGPAIVPSAAAAAGAVAALGPAAAGVAGALGVTALAAVGVVGALKAMEQASEKTGVAGEAAMLKVNQAMADLSPEGRKFTQFLYGLKDPLLDLRRTAEAGLLPGAQAGIESLLTLMPDAITYTSQYATAVGNLAQRAGEAFAQPYWRDFAHDLVDASIPAMETAAHTAYNLAVGASGLVRAFLPLSGDIGGGLLTFSERFAQWSTTLNNNADFQQFLNYVREVGPDVAATALAVAHAVVDIAEAVAPIGGVTLTVIRMLAEGISAMPVPVLTALAAGIIAVTTASKALSFATAVKETGAFAAVTDVWSSAVNNARLNMTLAEGQTGRFGLAMQGLKGAGQGAGSAIGALASTIGVGGPFGIALAAGTILLGTWANAHEQAQRQEQHHKTNVQGLTEAIRQNNGVIDDSIRQLAAKQALDDGVLRVARQAGIGLTEVTDAYIKGGGALDAMLPRLDAYIRAEQEASQRDSAHSTIHTENIKRTREVITVLGGHKKAIEDGTDANNLLADATGKVSGAQQAAADAAARLTPAQKAVNDALLIVGNSSSTTAAKIAAVTTAYEAQWKSEMDATDAAEAAARATDAMASTLDRNKAQLAINAGSLDINTAKNRDQRQAILDSRDAIEAATVSSVARYNADIAGGVPMATATQAHHDRVTALINEATQGGVNKEQVRLLIEQYGRVPGDVKTKIETTGIDKVYEDLRNLKAAQMALEQGITPAEAIGRLNRDAYYRQIYGGGRATGGPIYGPGGPTADRVPAVGPGGIRYQLSDGEFIQQTKAVDYYGQDVMHAINQRVIPRELFGVFGGLGGLNQMVRPTAKRPGDGSEGAVAFATGGSVTWPFPLDVTKTKLALPAMSQQVLDAQKWLRAQDGKPYIWASAGPDGYDCSGIVSAVWNILHNRSPYSHTFSTMNQAAFFPKPGFGGPLTAGWSNAGEPGGGDVGHTSGMLGGLPFESGGGWGGVHVGAGATPVRSFAHLGHFAAGGPVHPLNQLSMDTGYGVLKPGRNVVDNGTGQNEPIAAGPIRLDEYSIQRLTQALTSRPSRVEVVGPNSWGLAVAGMTP